MAGSHTVIWRRATTVGVVGYTTRIFAYIRSRYYCSESLVSDIIMLVAEVAAARAVGVRVCGGGGCCVSFIPPSATPTPYTYSL